ncbi:MAG TPA: hypothetical protein VF552_00365 [Allosphingosinicella sp.]|jgi:hypothetical protein
MKRSWTKIVRWGALAALAAAAAAQPASAQLYLYEPDLRRAPIEGSDPLVGVAIPGATPAEHRASLIWNLRSGLNVAALQCQFSAYLRAVPNYNAFLAHHSTELASAYTTLLGYFRRVHGPVQGPRKFDDYSTQTYNNFSTLQAQLGFCQTATNITKEALAVRKGDLAQLATARMRELRNSLVPVIDVPRTAAARAVLPASVPLLNLTDPCAGLRGKRLRRCAGTAG